MAFSSWPTRGPLLLRLLPSKGKDILDELVNSDEFNKRKSDSNLRFFEALRDGGVWLS